MGKPKLVILYLSISRNTLTQRVQGASSEGSVEIDLSGLKDGNKFFNSPMHTWL